MACRGRGQARVREIAGLLGPVPRGGLPRPPRTQFMPVPGGLGRPPGG